jgi:hypothetical protein
MTQYTNVAKIIVSLKLVSNTIVLIGIVALLGTVTGYISLSPLDSQNASGFRIITSLTVGSCLMSAILYGLDDWFFFDN